MNTEAVFIVSGIIAIVFSWYYLAAVSRAYNNGVYDAVCDIPGENYYGGLGGSQYFKGYNDEVIRAQKQHALSQSLMTP